MKLSARNQLDGTVTSIRKGEAIANVVVDVAGQRLVASITVEAVDELGLAEGSEVTAVIKASDVMIATEGQQPDVPRAALSAPRLANRASSPQKPAIRSA